MRRTRARLVPEPVTGDCSGFSRGNNDWHDRVCEAIPEHCVRFNNDGPQAGTILSPQTPYFHCTHPTGTGTLRSAVPDIGLGHEPVKGLVGQVDDDALDLTVLSQGFLAVLSADAAVLHATPRRAGVVAVVVVDPHQAHVQTIGDTGAPKTRGAHAQPTLDKTMTGNRKN